MKTLFVSEEAALRLSLWDSTSDFQGGTAMCQKSIRNRLAALPAALFLVLWAAPTHAQSFNIDVGSDAGVGAGAPTAALGAAAAQFGHWNNVIGVGVGPIPLNNLG